MIEKRGLRKRHGSTVAVDRLTFTAKSGLVTFLPTFSLVGMFTPSPQTFEVAAAVSLVRRNS